MKQGQSLEEMFNEVKRQNEAKRDFIVDTRKLELASDEAGKANLLRICSDDAPLAMEVSAHTHRQIAGFLGINSKYYDTMAERAPELLKLNVNHWFEHAPSERVVRSLDGRARAFLSNRYRRLDNQDLLGALLPVLDGIRGNDGKGLEVTSCNLGESALHLKCVFPKLEGEVQKGDVVQAGIAISNSEIGLGSLQVRPLIYRLVCLNGMVAEDHIASTRRAHIGSVQRVDNEARELYSDETVAADDRAFWLKTRDLVTSLSRPEVFKDIIATLKASTAPCGAACQGGGAARQNPRLLKRGDRERDGKVFERGRPEPVGARQRGYAHRARRRRLRARYRFGSARLERRDLAPAHLGFSCKGGVRTQG